MKKEYRDFAKEVFIKKYIEENEQAPRSTEINKFLISFRKQNPEIDIYGFSEKNLSKKEFLHEGSYSEENQDFDFCIKDLKVQDKKISKVIETLDISKYSFTSFVKRSMSNLDRLEKKLNNLIINYSNSDLFLHSVEESFKDHSNIDLKNSTVDVFNGYATLKNKPEYLDLSSVSSRYSFRTKNFRIKEGSNYDVKEILRSNGKEWIASCICKEAKGRVGLQIELDLKEKDGIYLGSIIIEGKSLEINSKTYYGIEVKERDGNYRAIIPRIKRFSNGENFTHINEEKVSNVRITLLKEASDEKIKDFYKYSFNIDKIKIRTDRFEKHKEGVLYAGPYKVLDSFGKDINFSMAKLSTDTCCIVPDKSSVDFYISKNNKDWYEAFYEEKNQNVIKFSEIDISEKGSKIDENENIYSIIKVEDNYYLNYKINKSDLESINKNNIIIKRNLKAENISNYGADGGWFFDKEREIYKSTIEIDKIEGRYIDLGYTTARINGVEKSGLIKLEKGFHEIETSSLNYLKIDESLNNSEDIEEEDKLYPYNHKYLFQGYPYSSSFEGEKVYGSESSCFSFKLKYIPEEKFDIYEGLNIYTLVEREEYFYFKVNIDISDSSWKNEINNVIIYGSDGANNIFYLKAIIKSSDEGRIPHINSFSLRVI